MVPADRNSHLSKEPYEILLIHQGGVCAICKGVNPSYNGREPLRLATDHSHYSNADRGLLCHRCNKLLGLADDSPELPFRAIIYLKEHDGIQFWGLSGRAYDLPELAYQNTWFDAPPGREGH